jgi:TetR/AcrR family tetracycline transcriptional repressor
VDQPARADRSRIDRNVIIDAALQLLEEEGVAKLTTRRLAVRLGVQAPTLYWHIQNKDELLDLMDEDVCEPVVHALEAIAAEVDSAWQQRLANALRSYRGLLLGHRDVAQLLIMRPPNGPNRLRIAELTLGMFRQWGFPDPLATNLGVLVRDLVLGLVLIGDPPPGAVSGAQTAPSPSPGSARPPKRGKAPDSPRVSTLRGDDLFEVSLRVILGGIERELIDHQAVHSNAP